MGEITAAIKERLDFELSVIEKTGYPGYFLITQDFIREGQRHGRVPLVLVGALPLVRPLHTARGITNVDPIEYDLTF